MRGSGVRFCDFFGLPALTNRKIARLTPGSSVGAGA